MNKAKIFSAIACISIMIVFMALVVLGFEMETVRVWRMDGESEKANALIFSRLVLIGSLIAVGYISLRISEVLEGKQPETPVYDRTLEI